MLPLGAFWLVCTDMRTLVGRCHGVQLRGTANPWREKLLPSLLIGSGIAIIVECWIALSTVHRREAPPCASPAFDFRS